MSEPREVTGQADRFEVALRAAREAAGSARDVERLRAQLQLKLMHASGGATPPATALSLAKLALLGAGLVVLGALYVGLHRSPATPPMRAVSSAASAPARPLAGRGTAEQAPSNSAAHDSTQAPEPPAAPTQSVSAREKPKQRGRAHTRAAPAPRSSNPQPAAAHGDSATEIALITRAQGLLDLQPLAALTVLLEHERQFPRGILAEERDVLRVEAERALGRTPQAIAHAKAFCAQYPNSSQTRTLEHWLAAQLNAEADHK
jgi:hypothetical protein